MVTPSLEERLETIASDDRYAVVPAAFYLMREAAAELRRLEGRCAELESRLRVMIEGIAGNPAADAVLRDAVTYVSMSRDEAAQSQIVGLESENARLREALTAALGEVGFAEGLYELGLLCNRPKVTAEEEDEIIRRVSAITAKGRAALAPAKGGDVINTNRPTRPGSSRTRRP